MRVPITLRPDLQDLEPYVSPQRPARYRMNTNESPYPPPPELVEEALREIRGMALNRYPERDAGPLFDAISDHVAHPRDGLWVANGSNEVFLHLLLAFGGAGRKALTFEPTYALHSLIPRITGTEVVSTGRRNDFRIDLDTATAAIDEHSPDVVFVCSPNNPSGGTETAITVGSLAERTRGIVVVDEAYIEFADPHESVRHLVGEYPNVLLVRTFSKAWRLAGVRIGYMLAPPALVEAMARIRLPYHLSAVTQVIGQKAVAFAEDTARLARRVAVERDRIAAGVATLGLRAFPSGANFVLFRVDDAPGVWAGLLQRGVLIRDYSNVPALAGCLRVTAGTPEETGAFLDALREVLDA